MIVEGGADMAAAAAVEGDRCLAQREFTRAIAAYDEAINLAPRHLAYRFKRALARAEAGHLAEARAEFELLVGLDPGNADFAAALLHLQGLDQVWTKGQAQPEDTKVVLVVDDDRDVTGAVADRLQAEGWRVRRAHTLQEALDLGSERPLPALVVYDYFLGDVTGLEVRDELSYQLGLQGLTEPPYIMLTARNNPVTENYAARRGAKAYVLKSNWLDPVSGLIAAARKAMRP